MIIRPTRGSLQRFSAYAAILPMNETENHLSPGLYIHVPFCLTKCPYCTFHSTTYLDDVPAYLAALTAEMALYRDAFAGFDTVYLGGGTPSLLSAGQLEAVLNAVRQSFTMADDAEITIETNPADITPPYLSDLRNLGINRLNIGVQSFHDPTLQFLGRRHSAAEAVQAVEAALASPFKNTGIDLIYGVPGQSMDTWRKTIETSVSYPLSHLSCYQLTIEGETPFGVALGRGDFAVPTNDAQYEFFMATAAALEDAGYIHYEVSNFARTEALASRHNQKYWDHTPYLGLGPSAHSFRAGKRWWNHKNLRACCEAAVLGLPPVAAAEDLTPEELAFETLFLGLRTKRGVPADALARTDGNGRRAVLERLQAEGFLEWKDGFLKPTRRGMAVADSLALL